MSKTLILATASIATVVLLAASLDRASAAERTTKTPTAKAASAKAAAIEQGRYLILMGGCNDCHTPGFNEAGGKLPTQEWLVGSPVGFKGPWGTSYPINLRNFINGLTEEEWIKNAQTLEGAPPMPWWALHNMKRQDLAAIYAFVKDLGPKGENAPTYLPPHIAPQTPYINFDVVLPK
jgi:mono/diheme cytochrome c family protein